MPRVYSIILKAYFTYLFKTRSLQIPGLNTFTLLSSRCMTFKKEKKSCLHNKIKNSKEILAKKTKPYLHKYFMYTFMSFVA